MAAKIIKNLPPCFTLEAIAVEIFIYIPAWAYGRNENDELPQQQLYIRLLSHLQAINTNA